MTSKWAIRWGLNTDQFNTSPAALHNFFCIQKLEALTNFFRIGAYYEDKTPPETQQPFIFSGAIKLAHTCPYQTKQMHINFEWCVLCIVRCLGCWHFRTTGRWLFCCGALCWYPIGQELWCSIVFVPWGSYHLVRVWLWWTGVKNHIRNA